MTDITETEKEFLIRRASKAVNEILLEEQDIKDVATRAYQTGYAHANEDRLRVTDEEKVDEAD